MFFGNRKPVFPKLGACAYTFAPFRVINWICDVHRYTFRLYKNIPLFICNCLSLCYLEIQFRWMRGNLITFFEMNSANLLSVLTRNNSNSLCNVLLNYTAYWGQLNHSAKLIKRICASFSFVFRLKNGVRTWKWLHSLVNIAYFPWAQDFQTCTYKVNDWLQESSRYTNDEFYAHVNVSSFLMPRGSRFLETKLRWNFPSTTAIS